ncbi:MAG: tRNA lysidine(34) synthetase TilS [Anaerolineae bacterium]|nr:tRNA lysidine(34) synthetase TilS [Anaerolineae bacterium]
MKTNLEQEGRLVKTRALVVGVSGGPDSIALAHILKRLEYRIVAAHLDHGLRSESAEDEAAVQQFAAKLGVDYRNARIDVGSYAADNGLSVEEAARILRYEFLFEVAEEYEAQAVATGHNADDQVETVLMHMIRGAGLSGLRGMQPRQMLAAWSTERPVVRPLLTVWRDDILAYCNQEGIKPVFDQSNLDQTFFRNRLRHELIPDLESYNPAIKRVIWRMGRALSGDYAALGEIVQEAWEDCVLEQGAGYTAFSREKFVNKHEGVRRGLARKAMATLRPNLRDIDFEAVERFVHFAIDPPRSQQQDLIAGLRLIMEGERVWVAAWEADLPQMGWPQISSKSEKLGVPGELRLPGGWLLTAGVVDMDEESREKALANADPFCGWLDGKQIGDWLTVRSRQTGDRFQPLGMDGSAVKLSDFLINVKMPRRARDGWPLVFAGEQLVWVPGYRSGEGLRIRPTSQRVVKLSLARKEN